MMLFGQRTRLINGNKNILQTQEEIRIAIPVLENGKLHCNIYRISRNETMSFYTSELLRE